MVQVAMTVVLLWLLPAVGLLWGVLRITGVGSGVTAQLMPFTPYVALWSFLPLLLTVASRRWWPAAVAGLATALLLAAVLSRAIGTGDRGPLDGVTLRVMTANMLAGGADPATIARLVRTERVDVLALQEFTREARAALTAAGLDTLLPYAVTGPQLTANPQDTTGSAVYSRYPIGDAGVRLNRGGFQQAYGRIQPPGGGPLLIESAHARAPTVPGTVGDWTADLASEPVPDPNRAPQILLGDFNSTLDHAPFRALVGRGYRDAAGAVGAGLGPTWGPYRIRPVRLLTLDHILADRRLGVAAVSTHALPRSDHRALLAILRVPSLTALR
jgi:endonuclease/exonuclease/phosphatase family metal-dependent hydrolase